MAIFKGETKERITTKSTGRLKPPVIYMLCLKELMIKLRA
jgi:hypothetical protein